LIHRLAALTASRSYPETASSEAELLEQAIELMRRAKAEGGDRLCLPI